MPGSSEPSEPLRTLVRLALEEDVGEGDVTTRATVPEALAARAVVRAKAEGVLAGVDAAREVFRQLGATWIGLDDGEPVRPGGLVARVHGPARALLVGERTALNFLQHLSGVATLTRRFVDAVEGTGARILDTRKTTPGMRALEKAAVRAGGGANHRFGLHDMVLVKENHVAAAGGLEAALERVRASAPAGMPVEVEVRDLEELRRALALAPDRVLLDNMDLETLAEAVRVRDAAASGSVRPVELEASGNMTLDRVAAVAATGVDFISVGALTHSAPVLDLSMIVES